MMDDHVLPMPNIDALLHTQKYYNQLDVEDDHRKKCKDKSKRFDLYSEDLIQKTNLFIRH
jgi:hypothetical protein